MNCCRLLLILAIAAAAAACNTLPRSQSQPSQAQPSQAQPSQAQPSQAQPSQAQPSQGQAQPAPATTPAAPDENTAPAPEVAALPINDDPAQLMGLGPRGLTDVLGPPEIVRREDPAEIWQYRNTTCVLDVFLYPDSAGRQVTYVEARDSAAAPAEPRACLGALLREKVPTS